MKKMIFWLLMLPFGLLSCTQDDCSSEYTYSVYHPIYMDFATLRQPVTSAPAQVISQTGKIYLYKGYLLVNEPKKGIHIIDNRNPSAPIKVSFLPVPGNVDMAIRNDFLYVDNYVDLLIFDISDPLNVQQLNRVENVFPQDVFLNAMGNFDASRGVVVDWEEETVTEQVECGERNWSMWGSPRFNSLDASEGGRGFSAAPSQSGVGGSMARFTISQDYLYAVTWYSLFPFNLVNPTQPQLTQEVRIGSGIETIFPYGDKLFIGAQNGMHIFDASNPASPQHLSTYRHVNSCDPVVVQGDFAYVTLRGGTECQSFTNQLDVVDIRDLSNPVLHKTYPMENPHGLAVDGDQLFVCEGDYGLKHFTGADPANTDLSLVKHFTDLHAYDVIAFDDILMMIGDDGLYQYDYSNPEALQLLSTIQIVPAN